MNRNILITAMFICFTMACSEQNSYSWNNGQLAKRSEVAKRGWIPVEYLPSEATSVKLQYDLDTNIVWLRFDLKKQYSDKYITNFSEMKSERIRTLKIKNPRFCSWWFDGLIEQQPSNDGAMYANMFKKFVERNKAERMYLFIDKNSDAHYLYYESRT